MHDDSDVEIVCTYVTVDELQPSPLMHCYISSDGKLQVGPTFQNNIDILFHFHRLSTYTHPMVLKSLGRLIRRGIGQAAANDFARPEWGTAQETQARVDSLLCSQDHLNRIRLIPSSIRGDESIMNLHAEEVSLL